MANEIRVRSNFQAGTITDNPLTNVATTINSAAFASLPAIGATQHLPIVLDPLASAGAPEIVWITAHTASATSATVVRAQEGTAARQHASGTVWRHAALVSDYDAVLGYAQVTAGQTGITTVTDLTSLSVAVNVPYSGHRVKITGWASMLRSVADGITGFLIRESSTTLARADAVFRAASEDTTKTVMAVIAPTSGAHTYKLSLERTTGTGTTDLVANSIQPAFILVEDLGPAA